MPRFRYFRRLNSPNCERKSKLFSDKEIFVLIEVTACDGKTAVGPNLICFPNMQFVLSGILFPAFVKFSGTWEEGAVFHNLS